MDEGDRAAHHGVDIIELCGDVDGVGEHSLGTFLGSRRCPRPPERMEQIEARPELAGKREVDDAEGPFVVAGGVLGSVPLIGEFGRADGPADSVGCGPGDRSGHRMMGELGDLVVQRR